MKESLKERLKRRREKLKERNSSGNVTFIKEGKTRIRILPIKDDDDWAAEMVHFYLGPTLKGIFSRASIGEDCPILEYYEELKSSSSSEDKELAKKFPPRKKYLVPAIVYKDDAGKEVDDTKGVTLVMLPTSIYGTVIDYFLDTDLGDFTDPDEGYDLKITRTGSGLTDTTYSVAPMRPSRLPKKYREPVDLTELIKQALPSPDKVDDILEQWKAILGNEEGEEIKEVPVKKKAVKKRRQKR